MMISQGYITVNSKSGKTLGFTADKFSEASYLWRKGDTIMISLIVVTTPGKGYFSELIRRIESLGFQVAVPTPLGKMKQILRHKGFEPLTIKDPVVGYVEVWTRPKDSQDNPT